MLGLLLGALTGLAGPIATITGRITDLKMARLKTESDHEKALIDAQLDEAHDRKSVLVAEAGSRINSIIRALAAIGPISYLTKIFLFDKVIGSFLGKSGDGSIFNTDPLDSHLWGVVVAVIAFYFVYDLAAKWRK